MSLGIFEELSLGRMVPLLAYMAFYLFNLPTSQRGSLAGSFMRTALQTVGALLEPNSQCAYSAGYCNDGGSTRWCQVSGGTTVVNYS